LALALSAAAQVNRTFPANALRGTLVVVQPPELTLNGQPARLSPGSRIRDKSNRLQMSGALMGQPLDVHYTIDTYGLVHNVWILTAEESAKTPWPATSEEAQRWSFDAAAQAWTRR
jgi:hypothetical protein